VAESAESVKTGLLGNLTHAKDLLVENVVWAKDKVFGTGHTTVTPTVQPVNDKSTLETVQDTANETVELAKDHVHDTAKELSDREGQKLAVAKELINNAKENAQWAKDVTAENLEHAKDIVSENAQWAKDKVFGSDSTTDQVSRDLEVAKNRANESWEVAKDRTTETIDSAKDRASETKSEAGVWGNWRHAKESLLEKAEHATGYRLVKIDDTKTAEQIAKETRERTLADD
jgi:hypothetical protein